MRISAKLENARDRQTISLRTGQHEHAVAIAPRLDGFGSSANGGELLFLALATCYCNDIYREARQRGIEVQRVDVEVTGEFGGVGEAANSISYRASVAAKASREEIIKLMRHTDSVAEIQNTLRRSSSVTLADTEATTL